ncbi:MAG TPA: sulfotransferase [Myxococcota bacterium]|nr:sulfotransferase [Myxococcota bacterium]
MLELSEFIVGLDWNKRFQQDPMTGGDYAELLRAPHPLVSLVLQRGYCPEEVTYPFGSPAARYAPRDAIPWPLAASLPSVDPDPDGLFDEALAFCSRQPLNRPGPHTRDLFEFLTRRLRRDVWVERSAGSLTYLGELAREFPDAKFVHLHRQGEDTALSMREHPVFRLAVMLTYQIPIGESGGNNQLSALGRDADHVSRLIASRPPAEYFGRWWTEQIRLGVPVGHALGPDRYAEVSFEALIATPNEVLRYIAEFLELPFDANWLDAAAQLIDSRRELRAGPDASELAALSEACAPGNELLGRERRSS